MSKLLLFFIFISQAYAQKHLCSTRFRSVNYGCTDNAGSNSPMGSLPQLFDAFAINPSSIPTFLSPLGLEYIKGKRDYNLSLIKGLDTTGGAFSVRRTNMTFFSPTENYKAALKKKLSSEIRGDLYNPASLDRFVNFGLAREAFKKANTYFIPIGLGYRMNSAKQSSFLIPSASFQTSTLNASVSYYKDKPDKYTDDNYSVEESTRVLTLSLGLKLGNLLLDYTHFVQNVKANYTFLNSWATLLNSKGLSPTNYNVSYKVRTHIISATLVWENLHLTGAIRKQDDSGIDQASKEIILAEGVSYKTTHTTFGANYKLGPYISLGYHRDYIYGEGDTFLAQVFVMPFLKSIGINTSQTFGGS